MKHKPEAKFDTICYVHQRPNLLDDNWDMLMYSGKTVLQGLFIHEKQMPEVTKLVLMFPETWLNIIQQRSLFDRLDKYCPNLGELAMTTHSVYFIQCLPAECIGIIQLPEGETTTSLKESVSGPTYSKNELCADFSKIQVL